MAYKQCLHDNEIPWHCMLQAPALAFDLARAHLHGNCGSLLRYMRYAEQPTGMLTQKDLRLQTSHCATSATALGTSAHFVQHTSKANRSDLGHLMWVVVVVHCTDLRTGGNPSHTYACEQPADICHAAVHTCMLARIAMSTAQGVFGCTAWPRAFLWVHFAFRLCFDNCS